MIKTKQLTIIRQIRQEQHICIFLLILFSFLLLSIIPVFRFLYYDSWPGGELAYYHMKIGSYILENGIPALQPGVVLQRTYDFNPFDVVVGIAGYFFGMRYAAILLPTLFGLITLFFLYHIIKKIFPSPKHQLLACIFIAASPVFLTIYSELSGLGWIGMLMAGGVFFLTSQNKSRWLVFGIFPLILFYELFHGIIALLIILSFIPKCQKRYEGMFLVGVMLIGILVKAILQKILIIINIPSFLVILQQLFSDIGGKFGFSLFAFVLALVGGYHLWKNKKIHKSVLCLCAVLIFLSFFVSFSYLFYLTAYISIAATTGFFVLLQSEWLLKELKNITLFLVILGMLFSATSTISRGATAFPDKEMVYAMLWLEKNSPENAIILTAEKYGFLVEELAGRRVLIDKFSIINQQTEQVHKDMHKDIQTLFYTRKLDVATGILEKYNITYVVIFEEMKTGLIWKNEQQGLLFLLENGENFKKVFENNKVTIWRSNEYYL